MYTRYKDFLHFLHFTFYTLAPTMKNIYNCIKIQHNAFL